LLNTWGEPLAGRGATGNVSGSVASLPCPGRRRTKRGAGGEDGLSSTRTLLKDGVSPTVNSASLLRSRVPCPASGLALGLALGLGLGLSGFAVDGGRGDRPLFTREVNAGTVVSAGAGAAKRTGCGAWTPMGLVSGKPCSHGDDLPELRAEEAPADITAIGTSTRPVADAGLPAMLPLLGFRGCCGGLDKRPAVLHSRQRWRNAGAALPASAADAGSSTPFTVLRDAGGVDGTDMLPAGILGEERPSLMA